MRGSSGCAPPRRPTSRASAATSSTGSPGTSSPAGAPRARGSRTSRWTDAGGARRSHRRGAAPGAELPLGVELAPAPAAAAVEGDTAPGAGQHAVLDAALAGRAVLAAGVVGVRDAHGLLERRLAALGLLQRAGAQ